MCLGVPGRILSRDDSAPLAMGRVDFGGVVKEVCLATVPEATLGDYVIVHAGFAISRVDPEAAALALQMFADADQDQLVTAVTNE